MGTSMTKAAGKGEGNHPHDCFTTGDFKKGKRLGSGAFSTVYLGRCAHPRDPRVEQGRMYAVKQIVQKSLTPEDRAGLKQEIEILKELDSDLVMKLFAVYENKKFFQLVTELVEGGELFERIVEKDSYSETEAKKVVYNLIKAVAYVHKHDIVHRDLKPENVLLVKPDDDSKLKIADFGFAKHLMEDPNTACGTPGFVAPEILNGEKYGAGVDVWSCGVIVYIVMCGYPPFYDENQNKLFQKIKAGRYSFHKKFWSHTSEDAKDLIRKMLTVDQTKRASCAALLSHPWFGTDTGHVDLRHSIKHLRDAHSTNDLRFEQGHTANGAHAAPHEHDDYDEYV